MADLAEKGGHTLQTQSKSERASVAPEVQAQLEKLREEHGSTWDGPDDLRDPYNWSLYRKVSIAIVVSIGQLITLMSTSMMAPGLIQITHDLGMSTSTGQVAFSIFVLGLAFAPFVIAALSEIYGRRPIWMISNLWYVLWNALCPVGGNAGLMMVGRFMAGSGASVGITLTGPIMADMYRAEHRGRSLALATFIPYLGPALGPIVGGLITEHINWPWLFWTLSIADAALVVVAFFFLKESYTPILLQRQTSAQRNGSLSNKETPFSRRFFQDLYARLSVSLLRPFMLMVKRPVIQIIAFALATEFGVYCLMLSTFASLWIDHYGQSEAISSIHYIAIAIGTTTAAQGGGWLMDYIFRRLRDRNNGVESPEYRVPYIVPSVLLIPIGLFWYGWSAQQTIAWPMVDVGAAIFTVGCFMLGQGMLAYLLDEFKHAASANAAARMLSNIFGFIFPIFAPAMYARLGFGWGNSLLAFIFLGLGTPIPLILWLWGPKLRGIGKKTA